MICQSRSGSHRSGRPVTQSAGRCGVRAVGGPSARTGARPMGVGAKRDRSSPPSVCATRPGLISAETAVVDRAGRRTGGPYWRRRRTRAAPESLERRLRQHPRWRAIRRHILHVKTAFPNTARARTATPGARCVVLLRCALGVLTPDRPYLRWMRCAAAQRTTYAGFVVR